MRIAYLVLCHKNPEQVGILIERLCDGDADFYIHVDKKVSSFELPPSLHVFVLPEERRVDVRWASKSMVTATLELIAYMFEQEKEYDYVCLLSGQDLPIKSNDEIEEFFRNNIGKNFIEVLEHTDSLYKRYVKRNTVAYPAWMFERSFIAKVAKKLYIYLSGGYERTFALFRRKNSTGLSFEFGSQWWCLTYDCLRWISEYLAKRPEVLAFFDHALTPDECLFQTVFMASPYREQRCGRLTYLEWGKDRNSPRILRTEDYELLRSSGYLFARKFDICADRGIIERLKKL